MIFKLMVLSVLRNKTRFFDRVPRITLWLCCDDSFLTYSYVYVLVIHKFYSFVTGFWRFLLV